MNMTAITPAQAGVPQGVGFEFVRELAAALSAGPVELPSFPDVALRVQDLLADESVSTEMVVRIVGAEPVLAARVVSLANAAAMNPSSTPVTDLRTAVARLGFDSLRAAAVSFAVAQLRRREEYREVEPQLTRLWLDSVTMASSACVVARRSRRMSPDTALFAGLVASVGRIYILTRAAAHPALFADPGAYQAIVRDWHAGVARALLESWQVVDEVVEAVHTFETRNQATRPGSALPDVLAVAAMLNAHRGSPELLFDATHEAPALARLGLQAADCSELLSDSAAEMASLRAALGR
jgi:HD-like signal output (HDOD) protein